SRPTPASRTTAMSVVARSWATLCPDRPARLMLRPLAGHDHHDRAPRSRSYSAVGAATARRHAVRPVPDGRLRAAALRPLLVSRSESEGHFLRRPRVPVRPPRPRRLARARAHRPAHPRGRAERIVLSADGAPL